VVLAANMNALWKHSPVLRVPSIDERLDADAVLRRGVIASPASAR